MDRLTVASKQSHSDTVSWHHLTDYRFENGIKVRLEGEGCTPDAVFINTAGQIYPIGGGMTMNAAVSGPWQGGEVYAAVNNLFDTPLVNPTATSVRNLNVVFMG